MPNSATHRGISAASAKRLALRRHWRRQRGNDGQVRVAVPVTAAVPHETPPGDGTGDAASDITGDSLLLARGLAALEDAVQVLREQLADAQQRANEERQRAEQANARADGTLAVTLRRDHRHA